MGKNDFLMAEYRAFTESFWKNEEVGEKRVDFFITLTTAVLAAVVTLISSDLSSLDPDGERRIATAALLGTLLFGLLFFVRILHRNRVTDEYKGILNYLRKRMTSDVQELADYELPFVKHERFLRGGLADTLALMNSILVAVIAALWFGSGAGWLLVLLSLPFVFLIQVSVAKIDREQGKKNLEIPQTFRVGVGAVIIREDGFVLAFERKDHPGSWQLPQGGNHPEESFYGAVIREVEEETGIGEEDLELLTPAPRFFGYELPQDKRSRKTGIGQVQRWFLFRFLGSDDAITLGHGEEFRSWGWMPMSELVAKVGNFKQEMYSQLAEYFSAKLHRED